MDLPFRKEYPDFAGSIRITEGREGQITATIVLDELSAIVQLENKEEAEKLISEYEDRDGELMHKPGAIFGKYPELHKFRP